MLLPYGIGVGLIVVGILAVVFVARRGNSSDPGRFVYLFLGLSGIVAGVLVIWCYSTWLYGG